MEELKALLKTMKVPSKRVEDIDWLNRNLGTHNSDHPNFPQAIEIIKRLLKTNRT